MLEVPHEGVERPDLDPVLRLQSLPAGVHHDPSHEAVERALRTGIPSLPADTAFHHGGTDTARTSELLTLDLEIDDPEHMVLRAATTGGGWIIANDMWMPGWTVAVDGEAKPPLVLDGWLRGVEVPAGEVRIEWRYLPDWFRWWPWCWIAWLLLCALGWPMRAKLS